MISFRSTLALAPLFAACAFAQHPAGEVQLPAGGWAIHQELGFEGKEFAFVRAEFNMESKLVKGAPYSAQAVTEFTQTLADGNRISRTTSALLARDSDGRTRREQSFSALGPWAATGELPKSVFIHDPVAGVSYVYESSGKIARQTRDNAGQDRTRMRELHRKLMAEAGVKTSSAAVEPAVNKESLGTQTIEGLPAEGARITRTIPAGSVGNDRPIDVVSETWYSPDLQVVVMSKTNDPRTGNTVYKLTRIDRAEPSPALFNVPADYTVQEAKDGPVHVEIRTRHQ